MADGETVTVPGTPAGVRQALDALESLARARRLPDALRRRLLTALDEVLSNIVRHSGEEPVSVVELRVSPPGPTFEVAVSDGRSPFNPLQLAVPDTSSGLDERRPGGLGIMLVRALADDVRYERRGGRNHLTMTWWVPSEQEEISDAGQ